MSLISFLCICVRLNIIYICLCCVYLCCCVGSAACATWSNIHTDQTKKAYIIMHTSNTDLTSLQGLFERLSSLEWSEWCISSNNQNSMHCNGLFTSLSAAKMISNYQYQDQRGRYGEMQWVPLPYTHIRPSAQSIMTGVVTRLQCNLCCTQPIKTGPKSRVDSALGRQCMVIAHAMVNVQ